MTDDPARLADIGAPNVSNPGFEQDAENVLSGPGSIKGTGHMVGATGGGYPLL